MYVPAVSDLKMLKESEYKLKCCFRNEADKEDEIIIDYHLPFFVLLNLNIKHNSLLYILYNILE